MEERITLAGASKSRRGLPELMLAEGGEDGGQEHGLLGERILRGVLHHSGVNVGETRSLSVLVLLDNTGGIIQVFRTQLR